MLSILLVVDTENRSLRMLSDSKAFLKVYPQSTLPSTRQSSPLPPSSPLPQSSPPQSPQPAQPEPTQRIQHLSVATTRGSLPRSSPLLEEPAAHHRQRQPTPVAHYRQHGQRERDSCSRSPDRRRCDDGEHCASRRQREYWYDRHNNGASTSQGRSHHR